MNSYTKELMFGKGVVGVGWDLDYIRIHSLRLIFISNCMCALDVNEFDERKKRTKCEEDARTRMWVNECGFGGEASLSGVREDG